MLRPKFIPTEESLESTCLAVSWPEIFEGPHGYHEVFASIEEDLRHQYSIGYTPTAAAPGYRHIHVAAKQKGLTVQAREGYYAL
jgi:hypothetical protein